jgi:RNase P subunit RPR2
MVVELDAMRAESATPVLVFEFACETRDRTIDPVRYRSWICHTCGWIRRFLKVEHSCTTLAL